MTDRETIALLRFLRAGTAETGVLNDGPPAQRALSAPNLPGGATDAERHAVPAPRAPHLAERLLQAALQLRRAPGAASLAALAAVAGELTSFDPATLVQREQQLAFWINVYNALVEQALTRYAVRESVRELPGFFHRAAYSVGGQRFALDEIEHGVLRGNRAPLPGLPPPFATNDPRLSAVVLPPEPRVHTALHCATRSCPPLRPYTAATLEADLEAAARGFVAGGVALAGAQLRLAAIFDLYRDDFGGDAGVRAFILARLPDTLSRRAVEQAFAAGHLTYDPYDWALAAR